MAGQHKKARANDRADSERDQIEGGERPLQTVLITLGRLGLEPGN